MPAPVSENKPKELEIFWRSKCYLYPVIPRLVKIWERFSLSIYHSTVALQTHIIWGMRNMLTYVGIHSWVLDSPHLQKKKKRAGKLNETETRLFSSPCLCVGLLHVTAQEVLNGCSWNLAMGSLANVCKHMPILVNNNNNEHFTCFSAGEVTCESPARSLPKGNPQWRHDAVRYPACAKVSDPRQLCPSGVFRNGEGLYSDAKSSRQ
jgi:hypothetical protein